MNTHGFPTGTFRKDCTMITARNRDRSIEIVIYEEPSRLVIAFNRTGTCLGRITVPTEALTGPFFQIEIPTVKPKGN